MPRFLTPVGLPAVTDSQRDALGVLTPSGSGYQAAILHDGPSAYWRMGEASGLIQDSAGTNHATVSAGTPTYTQTGALANDTDRAIEFDGTSEYFTVPSAAGVILGNAPFTIECWAKRALFPAHPSIIVWKDNAHGYNVGFDNADDKFFFGKAGVALVAKESATTTDTNWHHFVVTRAGSASGQTLIYKDGVDVTSFLAVATLDDNATPVGIANTGGGGTWWFGGLLDEIALYQSVLTPAQIAAHFAAAAAAPGATVGVSDGMLIWNTDSDQVERYGDGGWEPLALDQDLNDLIGALAVEQGRMRSAFRFLGVEPELFDPEMK